MGLMMPVHVYFLPRNLRSVNTYLGEDSSRLTSLFVMCENNSSRLHKTAYRSSRYSSLDTSTSHTSLPPFPSSSSSSSSSPSQISNSASSMFLTNSMNHLTAFTWFVTLTFSSTV